MEFLNQITDGETIDRLQDLGSELVAFVRHLAMGNFYAVSLEKLFAPEMAAGPVLIVVGGPRNFAAEAKQEKADAEWEANYREQLRRNAPEIERLVIEMLGYQPWTRRSTEPATVKG